MKPLLLAAIFVLVPVTFACSSATHSGTRDNDSAGIASLVPNNGEYPGKGKITKLNVNGSSIELDHEDIPGVMPAMKMEFFVIDDRILEGLSVGDDVTFTLRYRDGQETITEITKQQ